MDTISEETLHALFSIHNAGKMKDMQRLSSGGYSNYYTMYDFLQFKAGFNCAVNYFKGDNK